MSYEISQVWLRKSLSEKRVGGTGLEQQSGLMVKGGKQFIQILDGKGWGICHGQNCQLNSAANSKDQWLQYLRENDWLC